LTLWRRWIQFTAVNIKKKREAEYYNDIIKTTVMLWKGGIIWDGWKRCTPSSRIAEHACSILGSGCMA